MKKLSVLIGVFVLTRLSYAGPDIKALVDYEENDIKEAIAAEIAEAIEKKESSLKDKQVDMKPLVTGVDNTNNKDGLLPKKSIESSEKEKSEQSPTKQLTDDSLDINGQNKDKSKNPKLNQNDADIEARLAAAADKSMNGDSQESEFTSDSPVLSQKSEPIGLYFGFSLTAMASNSQGTATVLSEEPGNDRQIGFTINIGYEIVDNLSVEFRGAHGMVNSVLTPKFDSLALYLKPNVNLFDDVNLYALLGFGRSNLTGSSDKLGFTYGTGIKYSTIGNSEIFADAVNYLEEDGTNSMWGYNLGLEFKF